MTSPTKTGPASAGLASAGPVSARPAVTGGAAAAAAEVAPASGLRPDPARRLAPRPAPKPRRHGLYAAAWAGSGLIAGTYVFALILRQDGGPLLARWDRETVDVASVAKTQADVAQLQKSMGQIEHDLARIKIDQAQADEREKHLVVRMSTVESRVTQFGEQIAAAVTPPAASKTAKAPLARGQTEPSAKQPTSRIATATIPVPATAPAAQPAADVAGVLLARGPSLDALRLSWNLLNERHKGTLKAMEPRVVEIEPGAFQLIAGPIANPADALKVCATLKARGVACQPTDYRGGGL